MRFPTSLVTISLVAAAVRVDANPLIARAACNADNCARAVTGTRAAQSSHLADCSSFLRVTVTPATSTVTATATPPPVLLTSTITTNPVFRYTTVTATVREVTRERRDVDAITSGGGGAATTVSPTAVPGYASACSGTARYSSACSCAGVTASTTTAATPLTTVTVTLAPSTSDVFVAASTTVERTVTATQTLLATALACGSNVVPGGGCGCHYTVNCGKRGTSGEPIATLYERNEIDCALACDGYMLCQFANYNLTDGSCVLQNGSPTAPGFVAEPDEDSILVTQQQCDAPSGAGCS